MARVKMDIVETVRKCVNRPTQSCCSNALFNTILLLIHLIGKDWKTTKELCEDAMFANCNEARVYLYRLKDRGVLESRKIYDGEAIWKINEDVLKNKHMDLIQLKRLLYIHLDICSEYYSTGVLKKPAKEEEEELEEEEWEEEEWEEE
jgi:hypothetical protein